jgi:hypothetical protein
MAHMNLDPNQIFGQLRPLFSLAGSVMICAGLLKFFGVDIPISSGLELAVAGFLIKSI